MRRMGWLIWLTGVSLTFAASLSLISCGGGGENRPSGRIQLLAVGGYDSKIRIWQLPEGILTRTISGHTGWVNSICFSPDGRLLASGSKDGTIKIWKVEDGSLMMTLEAHGGEEGVDSVSFSPNGQILAAAKGCKAVGWDGWWLFFLIGFNLVNVQSFKNI